ncbi:MAG TPA: BTAD domain-containing putative transcriptional regulator [Gaiella sp.]|nr:BTAD domain-containing putative transcriptional regulator [Gaiella sp.]
MEFLLLGPMEARSGRASLALGGPRQRAVLADLLLHVGSVVSMDSLIDDIWGSDAPPNADAVVQNGVHRLRLALGRETIETRAPGYVLRVDPGAIDAHRFERLVHDAKPLPPAERSAALTDALALWRGPAFADLAFESFLQAEIARLDELRVLALEDRIEAEIELGHHDDAIPDTATLASQHPHRERLCRLLMLALHRAGRDQQALDAYESTRRALDDLWGLEPSQETRALHHMILTQDPAIAPARPVAVVGGSARRPVSLLLVEPLLDDELELEAAGAALEGVRRAVADVAARHGGALSPESGVELVAAFGVDGAHEDDVVRAARAAVELRAILCDRGVDARQAVGTGRLLVEGSRPVLVGPVVGRTRRALRDVGANEIQLTAVAARLGGDAFELDVDGRLLGVRPGRPRQSVALAPLVGRSEELADLRAAFDRVVETRKPVHAVVVGEPGIGKTRFVAAFVEDVSAVVLEAACTPYGEGITFQPLSELTERAALLDEDAPTLREVESADAALAAARTLFEHFTASGPLVVVLDDLHWAVPTFLDLVEYSVRAVDGPLLIVSVTRPELIERRSAWGEGATVLEPLAGDDARLLVDALPERDALDEKLAAAILETAEGVPLFLEQLAAHAVEAGLAEDRVPMTLDALLASRIDGLEPGERAVLSRAAVIGRAFSRESLGALTPDAETRELPGRLASLERRRLVRPRGDEHEFVHPLVRGAVYDTIGRPERAVIHEAFARWLDERGEADELVGAHLERAARDASHGPDRDALAREASTRLGGAGNRAIFMYDYAAAVSLLERATALLDPADPERLELECALGQALKGLGDFEAAGVLLERVADRAQVSGDRRLELRARVELVYPLVLRGVLTIDDATTVLDQAVTAFSEEGDTLGVGRAELAYALVLGDRWRNVEAMSHVQRADDAFRRIGIVGYMDVTAVPLAVVGTTKVGDALRLCETARNRHPDRLRHQAYLRLHLALLRALANDLVLAREDAAEARLELERLGEEAGLGIVATHVRGSIAALAGAWAEARASFGAGAAYASARPSQRAWHAYFLARLGEAALGMGDTRMAAGLAEKAAAIAVPGDVETEVWWRRVAARALSANGQPRKAIRLGTESVTMADRTDNLLMRGAARLDLAEIVLRARRTQLAVEYVREGLELLDRKGAVLPAANGRSRFAVLLAQEEGAGATTAGPAPL